MCEDTRGANNGVRFTSRDVGADGASASTEARVLGPDSQSLEGERLILGDEPYGVSGLAPGLSRKAEVPRPRADGTHARPPEPQRRPKKASPLKQKA